MTAGEKRNRNLILANCWGWVVCHCCRNPAKIGSDAGVYTGIIGISAATAKGGDTHLNSANKNRTTAVTLYTKEFSHVKTLIH
jgi:hypothetical protein